MLHQRYTRIFKQIFRHKTVDNSLKVNVTQPFYDNYEAIMHFIQYLRKRQAVVEIKPDKYEHVYGAPRGMFFKVEAPNLYDFCTLRLRDWWNHKKDSFAESAENFQYKKYEILGPDLAAAKFIIFVGGKIRFKDHDEWIDKTKTNEISKLPNEFDETYILEEIDLNKFSLRYKQLHFIFNLYYLKSLNLKGCKTVDDWFLDKLSAEYPTLEYLDISECENVTERGLEALYRMPNLKKLIVTNFYGSAAFDLTCFMLEDVNPYLVCQIQQLKYKHLSET
ncbi:PREDICTED: ATP synthase subunit s-like protein [Eufriesea mexicana]|uniref:ATP synthase subunit s-like protein n=1 Tax=Eufriesea mexicana TaxID=516756 RepID=UPI00083BDE12|nr:PREDICTED: ATP synthase subunit s-like protein [Eufriesea mexicana]